MTVTSTGKKQKSTKPKLVHDYMLKHSNHKAELKMVSQDDIEANLLCPLCNHQSLISLTTKAETDKTNKKSD